MTPKEFIEKNIHLIDKNDFISLFFNLYEEVDFGVIDALEVSIILDSAKIEFEKQRDEALNKLLTVNIEMWTADSSGGVTAMPLDDFVEVFMGNRIGLPVQYISKYLFDNVSDWNQYIDIYLERGTLIIDRRKSL